MMSKFTKMWRVKHDEPLTYNERIINSACDIIEKYETALQEIIESGDIEKSKAIAQQALKPRI